MFSFITASFADALENLNVDVSTTIEDHHYLIVEEGNFKSLNKFMQILLNSENVMAESIGLKLKKCS